MSNVLDVSPPDITTYCYYGSLSSILKSQKGYYDWFSMNFISLRMNVGKKITFDITPSPVFNTPWTRFYRSPRDILLMNDSSIIDFVIKSINSGYYLMMKVNRFYIKCNFRYMKSNNDHEIFVYGYDKASRTIYVCDNLDRGRFVFETCDFDEFESAFNGVGSDKMDGIIQVKVQSPQKECLFDTDVVLSRMEGYLKSKKSVFEYSPLPERTVFGEFEDVNGLKVMNKYLDFIDGLIRGGAIEGLDLRNIHLLREHKICLFNRVLHLEGKGYIYIPPNLHIKLRRLVGLFEYVLLLSIKYNARKSIKTLNKIYLNIEEGVSLEEDVIRDVVSLFSCS